MKQMGITKKLRWAVLNQPTLIPSILNDARFDKKIFKGILKGMLPRRTSIEIEATGSLAHALGYAYNTDEITKDKNWGGIKEHTFPALNTKYNVLSLAIDDRGRESYRGGGDKLDYDEHKISIKDYSQLTGLYNILIDMQKYCALTTNSGCHIHLDITKTLTNYSRIDVMKWFSSKCTDGSIENIFGKCDTTIPFVISGGCQSRDCGQNKTHWIYLNPVYKSLEFRTGSMTFDYSTIVKWFIEVNKLLNEFENTQIVMKKNRVPVVLESPEEALEELSRRLHRRRAMR